MRHLLRCSPLFVLALVAVGCGGGGHASSDSGVPTLASSFSVVRSESGDTLTGIDASGRFVVLQVPSADDGSIAITYRNASGTKTLALPSGYTLDYAYATSGHYTFFNVYANGDSDSNGLLILNVDTGKSAFEAGRHLEAFSGDRIVTSVEEDSGSRTDYKLETLDASSATVSSTKSFSLPMNAEAYQLAGNYLLVRTFAADDEARRSKGRARSRARVRTRAEGDGYALYTTSGTKVADYAVPSGATNASVNGINAKGEAVGTADETAGGEDTSFGVRWTASGQASFLPGGGQNVYTESISDAGLIVGVYSPSTGDSQNVVTFYKGDKQITANGAPTGVRYAAISPNGKGFATSSFSLGESDNVETITSYAVR